MVVGRLLICHCFCLPVLFERERDRFRCNSLQQLLQLILWSNGKTCTATALSAGPHLSQVPHTCANTPCQLVKVASPNKLHVIVTDFRLLCHGCGFMRMFICLRPVLLALVNVQTGEVIQQLLQWHLHHT